MNIWDDLPKPFFVLAPMDDVTDTVFRRVISDTAAPDLFFTEFINVDALQSAGREATLPRLKLGKHEGLQRISHAGGVQGDNEKRANRINDTKSESRKQSTQQSAANTGSVTGSAGKQDSAVRKPVPIIAQIWGLNPENFYKSAREIREMGYDGVDLNFGCPDKNVVRNGACSAFILPENRERAGEIIEATREGAGSLPVSVKTRLGFKEIDLGWHEYLLNKTLNALSIHGRTKVQMSKVPADWQTIEEIRGLRDQLSPSTKIVGNGDVLTREQGTKLANKHGIDGIMIGRGIFQDPYVFAKKSPWADMSKEEKMALFKKHVELFYEEWGNTKSPAILKKFAKIYISGFDGAKELREKVMNSHSYGEMLKVL